jgi:hypothetical protein
MPAAIPLPTGWSEIPSSNVAGITDAFARLEGTFPKRYLHLNIPVLQEKMRFMRDDDSVAPPISISSCRIFSSDDISVFYFLRFESLPRAYCMSVGIDASVTSGTALRDKFVEICRYMQHQPGITASIDIVNQRPLPGDLDDTDRAKVVGAAFSVAMAAGQLTAQPDIHPGHPWPSTLMRWKLEVLP